MTKLLTSASEITKKIDTVAKSGKTFQNAVQLAAVSIIAHMAQHRDKTLLASLYDAMPNGSRRKTMVDWVNANVVAVECSYSNGGLTVELADVKSPEWQTFTAEIDAVVEKMQDEPWHSYAKEKGEQDKLSMEAIVQYLNRKANAKDADEALKAKLAKVAEFAESLAG